MSSSVQIIIFSFFLGGLIGMVQVSPSPSLHPPLPPPLTLPPSLLLSLPQRSGGGIGLAKLLFRFTSTRRRYWCFGATPTFSNMHLTTPTFSHVHLPRPLPSRACMVCMTVCLLIFFDDYTCVLVAGNSMRPVSPSATINSVNFIIMVVIHVFVLRVCACCGRQETCADPSPVSTMLVSYYDQ